MTSSNDEIVYIDADGTPAELQDWQTPIPADGVGADGVLTVAYFRRIIRIDEQIAVALRAQVTPRPVTDLPERLQQFRAEDRFLVQCRQVHELSIVDTTSRFNARYGKTLSTAAVQSRIGRALERRIGEARWDLGDLQALYAAASHVEAERGRTIVGIGRDGVQRRKWRQIKDKMIPLGASAVYGAHAVQVKYEQGLRASNAPGDEEQNENEEEDDDGEGV